MPNLFFKSLLLSSISTLLHAETHTVELPKMVVSATRSETPQSQLAAGVTVYTRKDIEHKQVKTLPDLLKGTLGLDLIQNGALLKKSETEW